MQLCGKCSNYNSEDAIFCGHCANRLNNNCPSCSFKNLWEQKFCGNCGKQLLMETELPPSAMAYGRNEGVGHTAKPTGGPALQGHHQPEQPLVQVSMQPPRPAIMAEPQHPVPPPITAPDYAPAKPMAGPGIENIEFLSGAALHQFEAQLDLPAYALLSIEFAHWDQALAAAVDPVTLDTYLRQCLALLEERTLAANGHISGSKRGILFVAFKRSANLASSLEQAITFAQGLLDLDFQFQGAPLQLRIGMDIEVAQSRNPLTSTIERSMGLPGTLTASELVYQQMKDRFPFETVGPVPLGKRTMTFYRLMPPNNPLPQAEEVLALTQAAPIPPPAVTAPQPSYHPQPAASPPEPHQETRTVQAEVLPTPLSAPLSATAPSMGMASTLEASTSPALNPPVVTPQHAEVPPQALQAVADPPMPSAAPQQVSTVDVSVAFSGAERQQAGLNANGPELPHYLSPALGLVKAPRNPNITCEHAVDALASELSGFLAQGINNKGKMISICAADGLGKSSVVHLARQKVDPEGQRAFWMGAQHYRCFHRDGLPLLYWIELVQNLLSLVFEGQSAREVHERIIQFLGHVYDGGCPEEEQALLNALLSVQPPQPLSVEARDNLGLLNDFTLELFQAISAKRPIVVVMEDLSYADAASLDLLTRLLEHQVLEFPIYIILTQSRDFYPAGKLAEALQKGPYKELVIAEMTQAEAERFLDDGPLGGRLAEFPVTLIDGILRHAKGLPLYMEEALRLLHLHEVLTVDLQTGKFILHPEFEALQAPLPDNVKALVRQRLDYLNEDAQYVLSLAAVLGEKFAVNVLMALAQMEEAPFDEALTTLFNHGYILPDAVNTGRFRHGLIWEAVYEQMDVDLQVQMHQLVSETLENDFNQGMTVNPMLIAYHSENGELPNRAMNYWNLTGIFAGQVGSLVGMNMAMFRALEVLELAVPDQPLQSQELALRIVETLGVFNLDEDPDLAANLLEWAFYYRNTQGDATKLIEPLGFLASAYENRGDFPKALITLEKALALIDPKAYPLELASLLINKMDALVMLGRLQQARELMARDIEPIAQSPAAQSNQDFLASLLQARILKAQILLAQCDNEAGQVLEDALQIARERGLEGMSIALQLTRGQIFLRHGQYESCDREADSLLGSIEAMADSDWFLAQWGLLAMMYHCELEDWSSASQLVLTVISKAERVRDYHTWVIAQAYAGHISGKMGQLKEARQLLEQAISLSSSHRFAVAALLSWRLLAEFELDCGNFAVAQELAARALDIADKPEIQHVYESIQLTLLCARALLAQGQPKEAGKLLEPTWPRVAKTQWQPLIAACAFDIGQLYKHLAQNVPSDLSRKYLSRSVEFFLKAKGIWLDLRHLPQVKKIDAVMPRL
jgi:tetratricopeptide (TPR) repeat protein